MGGSCNTKCHTAWLLVDSGQESMESMKTNSNCYGLKVRVSRKWNTEALTSNVMVLGAWGFGRSLGLDEVMRLELPCGISVLRRRDTRGFASSLSPHMHVLRKGHSGTQQEGTMLGRGLSPSTASAGTLVLDFPSPRTVRNEGLFLKPSGLWHMS